MLFPRLLPGQDTFVFTLYGTPGNPEELADLIQIMEEKGLGNGFDPGPAAVASSAPLIEAIAKEHWPLVCYPPDGGRMQVKGGTSVVEPMDEYALRAMDRAGLFCGIQLGEWGYHFHRLTSDQGWWKAVLGKDFDAEIQHFLIPEENKGYGQKPSNRRECYDQLREYFYWHRQAKAGRLISVTGHSHYEAYAAEWGAEVVGLEVGENIRFTQSKFAFARGASRQWNIPWSVQVSPWFGPSVTTHGPLSKNGSITSGMDAGHSLSLSKRLWLHAWFAGAAMVTPENSMNIFFEASRSPWELTLYGKTAAKMFQFMQTHDRGNPYTPVLIVLDHLAGYAPYHNLTWGVLPKTEGDQETYEFFENQMYRSQQRIPYPDSDSNPEAEYLHPTPFGEICDVMLNTVTGSTMSRYPLILLIGDMDFSPFFLYELGKAVRNGSQLVLQPRHVESMGEDTFGKLKSVGKVTILAPWTRPTDKRAFPISNDQLAELTRPLLPVEINGDPIQFQINQIDGGWVIELINNDGVFKVGDKPAVTHKEAVSNVKIKPEFECFSATEWWTEQLLEISSDGTFEIIVPPGESRFIELKIGSDTQLP